jgi:alkanesulfonate monooxygenase SsuD/methylene tetrahydromethanopterin reductase-like flavin-dependent oxidoreductase (luciferase family)
VADGFHVHPFHTVSYLKEVVIPAIAEGAAKSGRSAKDVRLYAPIFTVSGDTQAHLDESLAEARRQIAFYGSTPAYRPVFDHLGHGDVAGRLSGLARRGEWRAMAELVPDDVVDQVATVAKPGELARALRRRYDGILDRLCLYFPIRSDDPSASLEQFLADFRAAG